MRNAGIISKTNPIRHPHDASYCNQSLTYNQRLKAIDKIKSRLIRGKKRFKGVKLPTLQTCGTFTQQKFYLQDAAESFVKENEFLFI